MPTLTLNLSDYEFAALQRSAAASGLSIEETARAILHGSGSKAVACASGGGGSTATAGAAGGSAWGGAPGPARVSRG